MQGGNSHVIRLSVPMQILLDTFNDEMDTCSEPDPVVDDLISTDGEVPPTQEDDDGNQSNHEISSAALLASHSLVDVCLRHVCK